MHLNPLYLVSQEGSWFLLPASQSDQSSSKGGTQTGPFCPLAVCDQVKYRNGERVFKILQECDPVTSHLENLIIKNGIVIFALFISLF